MKKSRENLKNVEILKKNFKVLQSILKKTLKEIAGETGISFSIINNTLYGTSKPSFVVIVKLCETYNIDPNWLLFGRGEVFFSQGQNKIKDDHSEYTANTLKMQMEILKDENISLKETLEHYKKIVQAYKELLEKKAP